VGTETGHLTIAGDLLHPRIVEVREITRDVTQVEMDLHLADHHLLETVIHLHLQETVMELHLLEIVMEHLHLEIDMEVLHQEIVTEPHLLVGIVMEHLHRVVVTMEVVHHLLLDVVMKEAAADQRTILPIPPAGLLVLIVTALAEEEMQVTVEILHLAPVVVEIDIGAEVLWQESLLHTPVVLGQGKGTPHPLTLLPAGVQGLNTGGLEV